MSDWAILDDRSVVIQIVNQPARPDNSVRATASARVGSKWTGWDFEGQRFSSYEFLLRFTAGERMSIRSMAQSDSMLADFLQLQTAAQEIWADDPTTTQGMTYLVLLGIITQARMDEILGYG